MRVLLVINAAILDEERRCIEAGTCPRKDYFELQRALGAEILDLTALRARPLMRLVSRLLGPATAQALLARAWAGRYDAIFVDRESTGMLLAALLRAGRRPRLVMIGHLLTPLRKRLLFRMLRLGRKLDTIVVHSSLQLQLAQAGLHLRADQLALLPYQTDPQFWQLQETAVGRQICSAGLEYRDYATLVAAVRDLGVDVVIAAASHWSKHHGIGDAEGVPPNVRVAAFDYVGLRKLYATSAFVVVPLQDVENQAGITTILEAMAMGKAVVVSHTRGQTDVVRDRRKVSRTAPGRPTRPDWATALGISMPGDDDGCGFYVEPGNASELRRAIQFLLDHPDVAAKMGANGRQMVERFITVDQFAGRLAALVRGELDTGMHPAFTGSLPVGVRVCHSASALDVKSCGSVAQEAEYRDARPDRTGPPVPLPSGSEPPSRELLVP
jgi:glycosyltransferase involved in cell wall biosynthesis